MCVSQTDSILKVRWTTFSLLATIILPMVADKRYCSVCNGRIQKARDVTDWTELDIYCLWALQ